MKLLLLFLSLSLGLTGLAQSGEVTIYSSNRIASLELSQTAYDSWVDNDEFKTDADKKRALVQQVYETFGDEFDFIFFILNEDEVPSSISYAGVYSSVSNSVQGIGSSIFDYTSSYGSSGRLKGLIQIPKRSYIMNGPTLHELMHNWGNRGINAELFYSGNAASAGSHWGYTGGNSKGQLGGFELSTLVDNGGNSYTVDSFGSFANGGNGIPYNELELYLMGMISPSELSNFEVFTGLSNYSYDSILRTITFSATTRTVYTATQLESELGTRIPSSANAQKDFRALTIVLTPTPLTTNEWTEIDGHIERLGRTSDEGTNLYNFWEATGGRGTLDVENIQNTLNTTSFSFDEFVNLSAYPIPMKDQVTISIKDIYQLQEINIYNLVGQKVASKIVSAHQQQQKETTINTQNLTDNIYVMEIFVKGYDYPVRRKIVKKS